MTNLTFRRSAAAAVLFLLTAQVIPTAGDQTPEVRGKMYPVKRPLESADRPPPKL